MTKIRPKRKPKNVDAVHYVDNKKFLEEIKKHKQKVIEARASGRPEPKLNDYLGNCILKIGQKISTKPNFFGYSFRDEMISDGVENCILYFDKFNADKYDNPFAYYSQIMIWAFVHRINKEERNRYITYKNFENCMINNGEIENLVDDENNLISSPIYDNILEFIEKFELKEKNKKLKRLEKKVNLEKILSEIEEE